MKILVTGTAGFIGFHLAQTLLQNGNEVFGLDNINDYYDTRLKFARLSESGIDTNTIEYNTIIQSNKYQNYRFIKLNLEDTVNLQQLFLQQKFDIVCNLAAQVGVRYSLINPIAYINSNMIGFANILECCRHNHIKHLVYASSSSVYGLNQSMPFSTNNNIDHPISLYAATKKSNELMAHTYSYLYKLPTTGLRFFTVYGPWGRPDMAIFLFTKAIIEGKPIQLFNNGDMLRDFTYIDDIVSTIIHCINNPAEADSSWQAANPQPSSSIAPYAIYNVGNNVPVRLIDFVKAIETAIGREAQKELLPMQAGDLYATWADVDDLIKKFNYKPQTNIIDGVRKFVEWYKLFYNA